MHFGGGPGQRVGRDGAVEFVEERGVALLIVEAGANEGGDCCGHRSGIPSAGYGSRVVRLPVQMRVSR